MRIALWLFLFLVGAGFKPAPTWAAPSEYEARVVRVVDADTIDVIARLRVEGWPGAVLELPERVRLDGIDTPESRRPRCAAEARAAAAAVAAVKAHIAPGSTIRLTEVKPRRDRYGRLLAQIRAPAGDLAAMLLAAGHARRYDGKGPRQLWC